MIVYGVPWDTGHLRDTYGTLRDKKGTYPLVGRAFDGVRAGSGVLQLVADFGGLVSRQCPAKMLSKWRLSSKLLFYMVGRVGIEPTTT